MLSQALRCYGRVVDPLMLTREEGHSDWTTFPVEKPTKEDFDWWEASKKQSVLTACNFRIGWSPSFPAMMCRVDGDVVLSSQNSTDDIKTK